MKKFVIIIQVIVILNACGRSHDIFRPIEFAYLDTMRLESFVDSFSIISLEVSEESILDNISQVIKYNNNYIVVDDSRTNKAIITFDSSGRFVRRISHFGRGPGEYLNITSLDITSDNPIFYVYDNSNMKVFVYDTTGVHVETIDITGITASDFKVLNDSTFAFYSPDEFYYLSDTPYPKGLIIYNIWNKNIISHIYYPKETELIRVFNSRWFTLGSNGSIGLLSSIRNTHYNITNDQAQIAYSFVFPNKEIGLKQNSDEIIYKANPVEADNYLFFYIFFKGGNSFYPVIFNKKTNSGYLASTLLGFFDEIAAPFMGGTNNTFISVIFPHELSDPAAFNLKRSNKIRFQNIDNPILVEYYLKH